MHQVKAPLNEQIANLQDDFAKLPRGKFPEKVQSEIAESLKYLEAMAGFERQLAALQATIENSIASLAIYCAQKRTEIREQKRRSKKSKPSRRSSRSRD